ncbi:MAG: cyclase family protein [Ruminiclostridium sp.]|nr:cyclase family protein [Ruminiclostridium sp.]
MYMKIKRIIDLSQPLIGGYTNPAFIKSELTACLTYERNGWMGEILTAATHVGTHIDAPAHRFEQGRSIDGYPLSRFQGNAIPLDLFYKKEGEEITEDDILPYIKKIKKNDIVLLCTGWGEKKHGDDRDTYINKSPWLGGKASQMLIEAGINAVGIDHFSIGGAKAENVAIPHEMLMKADILIFEDLLLPRTLLERENWYIAAFPIAIGKASGSFARIVALEFDNPYMPVCDRPSESKKAAMKYMPNLELPLLYPVRQHLRKTDILDLEKYLMEILPALGARVRLTAGKRIGICVGSRGIASISLVLKRLIDYLKSQGAEPVIIPCMGSHGGATAEGQAGVIAEYGITEDRMGASISSCMDVIDIGPTVNGLKVYMDTAASGFDTLIVVNRIKEHTDFSGETESGILKMLAIGLGNHVGASYIHSFGAKGLKEYIPEIAAKMIETRQIIGIGIVEDGYSEIDRIEIMFGKEIFEKEKELFKYTKSIKAKIPFKKLDYLIIEEMGKNISGSGMDTKVIGRIRYSGVNEPEGPSPDIITCLRLTPESHGNAAGVGLVDLISKRLFDSIDFNIMFINGKATKCPERYKIPMYLEDDRTAILTGLEFARAAGTFKNRIAFIKNTGCLETIYVSEPLMKEALSTGMFEIASSEGIKIRYEDGGSYQSIFT